MAQATWEKSQVAVLPSQKSGERLKFLVGGVLILAAVAYLIISGTAAGARYYITVDDLLMSPQEYAGKDVRISGAVIGDTIQYDDQNLVINFTIANIPSQPQDLAQTLHEAVNDPQATRLQIRVEDQVKPELLRHEAQAILTGRLGSDGVFYASELLLKCPTRFEETHPGLATLAPGA
jgi:cytochrome c-type biogenesis protein CcmE